MSHLGEGKYFSLNKKIEMRKHPKFDGYGLFAKEEIKQGEIIWEDKNDYTRYDFKVRISFQLTILGCTKLLQRTL